MLFLYKFKIFSYLIFSCKKYFGSLRIKLEEKLHKLSEIVFLKDSQFLIFIVKTYFDIYNYLKFNLKYNLFKCFNEEDKYQVKREFLKALNGKLKKS